MTTSQEINVGYEILSDIISFAISGRSLLIPAVQTIVEKVCDKLIVADSIANDAIDDGAVLQRAIFSSASGILGFTEQEVSINISIHLSVLVSRLKNYH